jgi:hypothetical protein
VLTSKLLVGGQAKTTGSLNNGPTFDKNNWTTTTPWNRTTSQYGNCFLKKNTKYFSWVKVS